MKTLFGIFLFLNLLLLFTHCNRELTFKIDRTALDGIHNNPLAQEVDIFPPDETKEVEEREPASIEYIEVLEQHREIFHTRPLQSQAVDFIFILDVSFSMLKDLARLGNAFSSLMSEIDKTDWRMAFTTADHGDHNYSVNKKDRSLKFTNQSWKRYNGPDPFFGKLMFLEHNNRILNRNWLTPHVPHHRQIFKHTLTRRKTDGCNLPPHCQGDLEQPLRAFNALFERMSHPDYPSHLKLRPHASLVVVFITNEDERVEDSNNATQASAVLENFNHLYPSKNLISFGILIKDDFCYQRQITSHSPDAVYGNKVAQLATFTGGQNISICEKSYHVPLSKVSQTIRDHIQSFTLMYKPAEEQETKVKFYSGQPSPWALRGKQILFKDDLQPETEVEVTYFTTRRQALPKREESEEEEETEENPEESTEETINPGENKDNKGPQQQNTPPKKTDQDKELDPVETPDQPDKETEANPSSALNETQPEKLQKGSGQKTNPDPKPDPKKEEKTREPTPREITQSQQDMLNSALTQKENVEKP